MKLHVIHQPFKLLYKSPLIYHVYKSFLPYLFSRTGNEENYLCFFILLIKKAVQCLDFKSRHGNTCSHRKKTPLKLSLMISWKGSRINRMIKKTIIAVPYWGLVTYSSCSHSLSQCACFQGFSS